MAPPVPGAALQHATAARTFHAARSVPAFGREPRVLTFTSLFPNSEQPLTGVFVRERIQALARLCDLRVMAPVPWVPALPWLPDRYRRCRRVAAADTCGELEVSHPRFFVFPKVLKALDGTFMAASCWRAVAELRRSFPFDLIDAHWACPDGVAAALLARRFGVPLAVTVRGDDINVFAHEPGRRQAIAWALRRADLVIALSKDLRRQVEELGVSASRVVVIPNGVNVDRFQPVDRTTARERLGLPQHARLLVAVGRLHLSKGYPILVEAVARLRPYFPGLQVAIVGEPDSEADATGAILETAARQGVEACVRLVGAQPQDALADWYSAADLFCLPTSREGSANVLLEAMSCGLPCVTTPVGGNPDVISRDVGILAPATPDGMSDAIGAALRRGWNRPLIRELARRRTWRVVAEECHTHLSGLVNRSREQVA